MADLSTINITQPTDGEAVSNGASRIRETRDAVTTSFDVEHALAGAHTFMYGAPGAKPAAGNAGRMFFDTTNERVQRDDGAVWRMLHAMQGQYVYTSAATGTIATTPTFTTIQTVSIDMPRDGKLLWFGLAQFTSSAANVLSLRARADGATIIDPQERRFIVAGAIGTVTMFGMITTLTGSDNGTTHSITLEATAEVGSGTITAAGRMLACLVL